MKQFNLLLLSQRIRRSLLLSAFFLGACFVTNAQVYTASLSGAKESVPNSSPGTGNAKVTVDAAAMTMSVNVTFSGLLAPTTASHIHAPTAVPGTGTAGVATTVPTFTGFPLGVTSGMYDHTFDMTLASSYNPAYLAANGGTPASAFAGTESSSKQRHCLSQYSHSCCSLRRNQGLSHRLPNHNCVDPGCICSSKGSTAKHRIPGICPGCVINSHD